MSRHSPADLGQQRQLRAKTTLLASRQAADDATFIGGIKTIFGLTQAGRAGRGADPPGAGAGISQNSSGGRNLTPMR